MPAAINTALFVGVSILFQFSIGLALAVFFFRHFPLSGTLRALFLVPWLLPLLVSGSVWSWMMNSDSGVINSFLEAAGIGQINWLTSPQWSLIAVLIANIWIGIPFNLVIMYSGLQGIPGEVYEAASIDGANGWQKFWRVTFPLLRPVSAITILLGLVYTLKVFDLIWIMTKGGPADASTTFAIWAYRLGFGSLLPDFSPAAAVGKPADHRRPHLRCSLHPNSAPIGPRLMRDRAWWKTVVGVILTAIMLFPVYWMINVSLTKTADMRKSRRTSFRSDGTLEGYQKVLQQQLPFLGTSLLVGLGTVALTLILAAPAAYSLAKLRPRGGSALSFVLLIAQMIPAIIMAMGFYVIYLNLGILNSIPGLILADSTIAVPFGVLIFTAFMSGIPNELIQAARVDGASAWRTFISVVLPVSRNSNRHRLTVRLPVGLVDFIFATTLDGGGDLQPITLGIYRYIGNNNQEWNAIMATAVVASIPAAVLLVVAQRYVAAGVTAGAVKD